MNTVKFVDRLEFERETGQLRENCESIRKQMKVLSDVQNLRLEDHEDRFSLIELGLLKAIEFIVVGDTEMLKITLNDIKAASRKSSQRFQSFQQYSQVLKPVFAKEENTFEDKVKTELKSFNDRIEELALSLQQSPELKSINERLEELTVSMNCLQQSLQTEVKQTAFEPETKEIYRLPRATDVCGVTAGQHYFSYPATSNLIQSAEKHLIRVKWSAEAGYLSAFQLDFKDGTSTPYFGNPLKFVKDLVGAVKSINVVSDKKGVKEIVFKHDKGIHTHICDRDSLDLMPAEEEVGLCQSQSITVADSERVIGWQGSYSIRQERLVLCQVGFLLQAD